jgi:hypothetical protein
MRVIAIALVVLAFFVGAGFASVEMAPPPEDDEGSGRTPGYPTTVFFYDNIESGNQGWTHGDYTATMPPHFHVDSYMAYGGTGHSWWCGNFDYDGDGGYGNGWTDFLVIPETGVPETSRGGSAGLAIGFDWRSDSEVGYDFSYVQAESGGVYVNLNQGMSGLVPWTSATFYLGDKDSPPACRFEFKSDGVWSDQSGNNTVGGGFACDNIKIFDSATGYVLFYDDVESGGLCTPAGAAVAGDFWHIDQICAAASMSHVWSVAYPDTSFVQPDIQNWLMSPIVNLPSATETCTLSYRRQIACQKDDNDFWTEELYVDGVWYDCGGWWGDICDANGAQYICYPSPIQGRKIWILNSLLPATQVAFRWTFYTTDDGTGPDACNHAGYYLDDFKVYGTDWPCRTWPCRAEKGSWGRVKSMFR